MREGDIDIVRFHRDEGARAEREKIVEWLENDRGCTWCKNGEVEGGRDCPICSGSSRRSLASLIERGAHTEETK